MNFGNPICMGSLIGNDVVQFDLLIKFLILPGNEQ